MVLIRSLEPKQPRRPRMHAPLDAEYFVFEDEAGRRYLQIDTGGSQDRKHPGKQSQTVQFDEQSIRNLAGHSSP